MQVAFDGHLKALQVRSCCTSALRNSILPVCHTESCPQDATFPVLHFPSIHTSSREMGTNYRSCCRGERDTRTVRSWAIRLLQWASLTWLRYRVLGTEENFAWPPCATAGKGAGPAGRHSVLSALACWLATRQKGWAASCHCVTLARGLSVCLGDAAPNGWRTAFGPPQQHEGH